MRRLAVGSLAGAAMVLAGPASAEGWSRHTYTAYSCSGSVYETTFVDPAFVPLTNAIAPNYKYVSVMDPRVCNPFERGHVASLLARYSNDLYQARASIPMRHIRRHSRSTQ
jgi:hypothetical protein